MIIEHALSVQEKKKKKRKGRKVRTEVPAPEDMPTEEEMIRTVIQETTSRLSETSLKKYMLDAFLPLHEAIRESLHNVTDADTKASLASRILLVGGSTQFPGFIDELEDKLIEVVAVYEGLEKVEVLVDPKGVDPQDLAWKGASIVSAESSSLSMWIHREDFETHGLRIARERVPFYL